MCWGFSPPHISGDTGGPAALSGRLSLRHNVLLDLGKNRGFTQNASLRCIPITKWKVPVFQAKLEVNETKIVLSYQNYQTQNIKFQNVKINDWIYQCEQKAGF